MAAYDGFVVALSRCLLLSGRGLRTSDRLCTVATISQWGKENRLRPAISAISPGLSAFTPDRSRQWFGALVCYGDSIEIFSAYFDNYHI